MIDGLRVEIGPRALVVTSESPLEALSSAVFRGGLVTARSIVNVHVNGDACVDPEAALAAYLRDARLPAPCVGLLTGARTERATGLATADGPASGTSTDAVVIAATGRGRPGRFGGPVSELGWVIAQAARQALTAGIGAWVEERR